MVSYMSRLSIPRFLRPSRLTSRDPPFQSALDLGFKSFGAQNVVAVRGLADFIDQPRIELVAEQLTIGRQSLGQRAAERFV